AAVSIDDFLDDGKAEARALFAAGRTRAQLLERAEQQLSLVFRDAGTLVLHAEREVAVARAQGYLHRGARRRELDRVADDVVDDRAEARRVDARQPGAVGIDLEVDLLVAGV